MKKVLLVVAVIAFVTTSSAQTIGAKAGVNFNTIAISEGDDFPDGAELGENGSGIGFHVGGYAQFELSDNFNFRPELLFTNRAVSDDSEVTTDVFGITSVTKTESDSKFSYISIPLLLEFNATENFAAHIGPVVSLLMGQNSEGTSETSTTIAGTTTTTSASYSDDSTEGLNGMDLGLGFGAIYSLESGLNFGIRYNLSLNTINEKTEFSKSKWGVAQFSIGYAFVNP